MTDKKGHDTRMATLCESRLIFANAEEKECAGEERAAFLDKAAMAKEQ